MKFTKGVPEKLPGVDERLSQEPFDEYAQLEEPEDPIVNTDILRCREIYDGSQQQYEPSAPTAADLEDDEYDDEGNVIPKKDSNVGLSIEQILRKYSLLRPGEGDDESVKDDDLDIWAQTMTKRRQIGPDENRELVVSQEMRFIETLKNEVKELKEKQKQIYLETAKTIDDYLKMTPEEKLKFHEARIERQRQLWEQVKKLAHDAVTMDANEIVKIMREKFYITPQDEYHLMSAERTHRKPKGPAELEAIRKQKELLVAKIEKSLTDPIKLPPDPEPVEVDPDMFAESEGPKKKEKDQKTLLKEQIKAMKKKEKIEADLKKRYGM